MKLEEGGGVFYALAGILLDVNGFDIGFHEPEKVFDTHFLFPTFCACSTTIDV